jgi:hypothetical protein
MTFCYDTTQFLTYKSVIFIPKRGGHETKTERLIPLFDNDAAESLLISLE